MDRVRIKSNGLTFHALGEGEGPLVLLLHGFPDTPHTFKHLIPALAREGYRAVAPWMRGYAPSEVPADGHYQVAALAQDVVGLIDSLCVSHEGEPAVLVGHDWGASAALVAALLAPDRVRRLAMLAMPHPLQFMMGLHRSYEQQRRSWYIFLFQLSIAEEAVRADDFALLERLWRDWSPGFEPPADLLAAARSSLREPANLEAALAYYRALFHPDYQEAELTALQREVGAKTLACPAVAFHGGRDGCIGVELAEGMEAFFGAGLERHVLPDAGHFLHLEAPDEVARRLMAFLKR